MNRIFAGLALVALTLLATNLYLGITGGNYNALSQEYRDGQQELRAALAGANTDMDELGRWQAQVDETVVRLRAMQADVRRHMMLGILAALVTVLVNSISVTYFIGTGRWCKEVSETYRLSSSFVERANGLKRRTFPWSLLGIVTTLAIATLGAASDPGTLHESTRQFVAPHYFAAIGGTLVIAWALWRQSRGIRLNSRLIEEILAAVRNTVANAVYRRTRKPMRPPIQPLPPR